MRHHGVVDDAQPEIRIGDRERREVDARLQQAHADGVLTLVEYDERAALCWAARTRNARCTSSGRLRTVSIAIGITSQNAFDAFILCQ